MDLTWAQQSLVGEKQPVVILFRPEPVAKLFVNWRKELVLRLLYAEIVTDPVHHSESWTVNRPKPSDWCHDMVLVLLLVSESNLKTSDEAIKTDEMMMKVVPSRSHSADGPETPTQVSSMYRVQLLVVYMLDVMQGFHSRIRTRCF